MSPSCLKAFYGSLSPSKCLSWELRPLTVLGQLGLIFHSPAHPTHLILQLHGSTYLLVLFPLPLCVITLSSGVECLWALRSPALPGQNLFLPLFPRGTLCKDLYTHHTVW